MAAYQGRKAWREVCSLCGVQEAKRKDWRGLRSYKHPQEHALYDQALCWPLHPHFHNTQVVS